MKPSVVEWFASSRVLIVAGKGGVGTSTVGATLGVAAARAGADVLLVELEGNSRLGRTFGGGPLTYDDVVLEAFEGGGRVRGCQLSPGAALRDYFDTGGVNRLTGRLAAMGALEVVTAAAPGLRDLLVLGKIRQLEQRAAADLIVVDGPASGHALGLLNAPLALGRLAASGPVRHQADEVSAMFADERRCQVLLVTVPEEGPVNEVIETAYRVEDEVGVRLGPVVVNCCWPPVPGLDQALAARGEGERQPSPAEQAARFRLERVASQCYQIERLSRELPLPQIHLPYLFTPDLGRADLDTLADALDAPPHPSPSPTGSLASTGSPGGHQRG